MLYWLTQFSDGGDFFNLFRYITFRAGAAFFMALIVFFQPIQSKFERISVHSMSSRSCSTSRVRSRNWCRRSPSLSPEGVAVVSAKG